MNAVSMTSPLQSPFTSSVSTGSLLKSMDKAFLCIHPRNVSSQVKLTTNRRALTVQASDRGRPNSAGLFIGGFVLGGIIVGTLGCVYAPQISKALAGTDRKDLMRKLPKFIYDEEKALENTRRILAEKIARLNSAIDEVSTQLHADDAPNGVVVTSDEIQAST